MTNSKIRNFFETLRSIKEDALLPFKWKSNKVTLHFKHSNVYFCFDNRLCGLQIRIFSERYSTVYTE